MKLKIIVPIVLLVILASIFIGQFVFAQNSQVTSNVSLSHLSVQLTYPSMVLPGQPVTINIMAQAKDSFQLTSLSLQVYLAGQNNLSQLTSATVAQNMIMSSGNQINKQVQVTVPSDATRTSLVAVVTESANSQYAYSYAAYPWNWDGSGMYGNYLNGNGYGYGYPYYSTYPSYSYSYQPTTDNAVAPLSYVNATTPEYVSLQSQYQQLQQQLNQTQSQNQQLKQQLQTAQNSTAQQGSTIANLNSELSSTQGTATILGIVAVILAIAAIALAVIHFRPTRTTVTESHPATNAEEKTTDV
jgi:hypothetical protein